MRKMGYFKIKGGENMLRRFKEARKMNNLKLTVVSQMLGVSQPTLSSWEAGRKSPTLETLEKMADLYGVSTDYLLGRNDNQSTESTPTLSHERFCISNGKPMWSRKYGWLLISLTAEEFITSSGKHIPFDVAGEVLDFTPQFAESTIPHTKALTRSEIRAQTQVWVEPISTDPEMREHLRGCYQVKELFVENEYGTKFPFSNYGVKWLAFNMK